MSLTITAGLGGMLQFPSFTPLAPALVTANLRNFWELPIVTQTETLASAYQHLSGVQAANPQLLESLGQLVQRLNDREERTAADSFIISRLIGEWGSLKDSVPPLGATPRSDRPVTEAEAPVAGRTPVPPSPAPPSPKRERRSDRSRDDRNPSMQFYTDGKGGLFPPSWLTFSRDIRDNLKIPAWNLTAKEQKELVSSEEANANFLVGVLSGWIVDVRTMLTETGAKGAGASGLASSPSVRAPMKLAREMGDVMAEGTRSSSSLSELFWKAYGAHVELRNALNRLTTSPTLLSSLEEADRSSLLDTLYGLDAAYLASLLAPLDRVDEDQESSMRDDAHGVLVAQKIGQLMNGFPLSPSTALSGSDQVKLSSIEGLLRSVARETRVVPPSASLRAFLRQLLPSEFLRLGAFMDLIREKL